MLTRLIQFLKKGGQEGGQGKNVHALQEVAGQAAKPGSVWPSSTNRLLPQLSYNRSSCQASPSYWRWWLDQLASWKDLLGGLASSHARRGVSATSSRVFRICYDL